MEFETGAPLYVKFGAVLTKREVLALIECLGVSLRESGETRTGAERPHVKAANFGS